jgi:hypothetical protein
MDDWGRRILVGLRQSSVLLCCLSSNYFASRYGRMEFEEYLARHSQVAVGDDTIAPVYFVRSRRFRGGAEVASARGELRC